MARRKAWQVAAHYEPDHQAPRPQDLVQRNFQAERPDQLWVADFTYVSTWEGWIYVTFIIDVYARRIVGWQTSTSMRTEFVLDALEQRKLFTILGLGKTGQR